MPHDTLLGKESLRKHVLVSPSSAFGNNSISDLAPMEALLIFSPDDHTGRGTDEIAYIIPSNAYPSTAIATFRILKQMNYQIFLHLFNTGFIINSAVKTELHLWIYFCSFTNLPHFGFVVSRGWNKHVFCTKKDI